MKLNQNEIVKVARIFMMTFFSVFFVAVIIKLYKKSGNEGFDTASSSTSSDTTTTTSSTTTTAQAPQEFNSATDASSSYMMTHPFIPTLVPLIYFFLSFDVNDSSQNTYPSNMEKLTTLMKTMSDASEALMKSDLGTNKAIGKKFGDLYNLVFQVSANYARRKTAETKTAAENILGTWYSLFMMSIYVINLNNGKPISKDATPDQKAAADARPTSSTSSSAAPATGSSTSSSAAPASSGSPFAGLF